MIINHNLMAQNSHRQLSINTGAQAKSTEKLSSGFRINRAGDDAAGLAISEKMRGQIRGLDQAQRNSQDAISLIQTAEGALNETHSILQRMRELAVQAANDTNTANDRNEIQKEINQLTSEINRIGNTTEFNTKKLADGTLGEKVGAVKGVYDIDVTWASMTDTKTLTIDGQTFNATSGTANPTADSNPTFKAGDATSLMTALNANTTLAEKYDISLVYSSDSTKATIRLTQKFGQESATAPTVGGTGGATKTDQRTGAAGTLDQSLTMQIGANQSQSMSIDINDMRSQALGLSVASGASAAGLGAGYTSTNGVTDGTTNKKSERALDVSTAEKAAAAITVIDNAIKQVSAERSKLGSFQNRLEHTINNLATSSENLTASESRIRDVDMAKEVMANTKNNILSQAAQAMLAQANQAPQAVLQLLR